MLFLDSMILIPGCIHIKKLLLLSASRGQQQQQQQALDHRGQTELQAALMYRHLLLKAWF